MKFLIFLLFLNLAFSQEDDSDGMEEITATDLSEIMLPTPIYLPQSSPCTQNEGISLTVICSYDSLGELQCREI